MSGKGKRVACGVCGESAPREPPPIGWEIEGGQHGTLERVRCPRHRRSPALAKLGDFVGRRP